MSSLFEEKTKQLNILLMLTSLLMQNTNRCFKKKKKSFLSLQLSIFSQGLIGGYRQYIQSKDMLKQKGRTKLFLCLCCSALVTHSETILGQWQSIDFATTVMYIFIPIIFSSPEKRGKNRGWGCSSSQKVFCNHPLNGEEKKKK